MPYDDKTLVCVQCKKEFTFTAGEQQFFAERNFASPPKRCKSCRRSRKRNKNPGTNYGEYRSPAFEASAPEHQKIRGRKRGGRRRGGGGSGGNGGGDGRTQRGGGRSLRGAGEYRSPAFRGQNLNPAEEYRAPGFREFGQINPDEEYRAPGFREFEHINPEEEYRAPGFAEFKEQYRDERPMFSMVCPVCGQQVMVPFLPEEEEDPMCTECYKKQRAAAAEEARRAQAEEAQSAPVDPPSEDPAAGEPVAS